MDKTFKEAIDGIRTAERGVDVREDIAQGMEYVEQYAEEVISRQEEAVKSAQTATSAASAATEKASTATEKAAAAAKSAQDAAASQIASGQDAANAKSSADAAAKSAQEAAAAANTDPTLSISGAPADAKAVGDALRKPATADTLGGIKVGSGLTVTEDGTVSADGYTKAEADAEHAKLQETLQETLQEQLGAQPVVVWSADMDCSRKSGKLQLPDTVAYLEIKANDAQDNDLVWYLAPGNTISGIGMGATANSGTTFTLSDDRVLTYNSSADTQRTYLVGYHYEKSAKFPCPVGYKSLTVNNNTGSFTADDAVEYALVQWATATSGDNPVTIRHSTILSRGRATGNFGFSQAGKISVPNPGSSTMTYYFTLYRYVTLDELTALLTDTQAAQSDTDAMTVDQEYRLTLLELGITDTDTNE